MLIAVVALLVVLLIRALSKGHSSSRFPAYVGSAKRAYPDTVQIRTAALMIPTTTAKDTHAH